MAKIKLTEAEQFIMEVIWSKEKAFMKDILEAYDEPKPASTTLATVLKRMQDKDLIAYNTIGNSREYYSLVKKEQYFSSEMQGMLKKFFNNSVSQFASYFTANAKLNEKQLRELRDMIDMEIEKKQKDG
ncbi:BlaI/MecI/CopY family transcriptional regulator [Elizabethkingia meningoseptica]|uniref:Penicillinase repressor n=1 Tax=Elizabethkingia meningoseptica TaxID=238 RepID=A0A1V3TWB5_ELIME|nr:MULTISPECIES: BlaI/MecI/CopY family transcriptional regulator [Elizabethkingia]AQX04310.1 penicillinase repressor [Elizabethkingia meningoseptica]AQX11777.1 penicillinase repressor [Elizabethkingia meningoseptica]AQX46352.1 penicillinase repressor [Elizabethkingia meningoseptica]EJK5330691.1 BlaI/MecI/CopY family transcriptional regulator [Elizabethkingia meningoseptica]EOR29999.1 CopY family transcriptional regulator [Elizabethkingia meningoseptica ATCC 13253 = NBRC 12535]